MVIEGIMFTFLVVIGVVLLLLWFYLRKDSSKADKAGEISKISVQIKATTHAHLPFIVYEYDSGYKESHLLRNPESVQIKLKNLLAKNPTIKLDQFVSELVNSGSMKLIKHKIEKKDFELGVLWLIVFMVTIGLFVLGMMYQKS